VELLQEALYASALLRYAKLNKRFRSIAEQYGSAFLAGTRDSKKGKLFMPCRMHAAVFEQFEKPLDLRA
jgi:hypothetical protein